MAQTPPPFETYQSPNPRKTTNPLMWVAVALVGFCCVALIAGAAMVFNAGKTVMGTAGCALNFAMSQKSIDAYVRVNGKYPPAATWQSDTQEYYQRIYDKMMTGGKPGRERETQKIMEMFHFAKPGEVLSCKAENGPTGISYNSDLAGKTPAEVKDKSTVLLFESRSVTLNSNSPYARPSGEEPKMFGSKRGWITYPVSGKADAFKSKNSDYSINDEDMTLSDEELGLKPGEGAGKDTGKAESKAADKSGV